MKTFSSSDDISHEISQLKLKGQKIGFVPTMGALHRGHLQLVQQSIAENDFTISSIFINPLQFNNKEDFLKYPQTLEKDIPLLESIHCNALFKPDYEQVYRDKAEKKFELGNYDQVMEGKYRPGHFHGVANVVFRFFEIVQPDKAYFGLKDYQQYLVIKNIVAPLFKNLEIIGVETVRDENGLALSSRNLRLSKEAYKSAIQVPELLFQIRKKWDESSMDEIKQWFYTSMNDLPEIEVEYLEVANSQTLIPAEKSDEKSNLRVFTAFYAGGVRLIDNISLV